jgi:tricorn protease-like protein
MATMSTTTGRLRRINRAPGDFLGADWSSRNRIVYQRRYVDDDLVDSIGIDLYAVNPAGGRLRRLTTTGAANSASWSPDGRRLVYSQFRGASSASAIWVMNADGSNKKRISNGYYPIWSPDEQRVAFVRNYGDIQRTDIVVARPDGTHQRRVLSVYDRIPTERGIGQLAWRPLRAGGNRR